MDYNPPGSSVHRIFQARILEWVVFPSPGEDNFSVHQNNLEGLLKHWLLGPTSKIFNSVGMEVSLKIYISNKFLDESVAIAWRTSLWKALVVYDMILTYSVQDRDNSRSL